MPPTSTGLASRSPFIDGVHTNDILKVIETGRANNRCSHAYEALVCSLSQYNVHLTFFREDPSNTDLCHTNTALFRYLLDSIVQLRDNLENPRDGTHRPIISGVPLPYL